MVCHKDLRHLPLHSERLLEISPGERESHRAINIAIGRECREEGLGWVLGQNDMKAEFDCTHPSNFETCFCGRSGNERVRTWEITERRGDFT
jgi:hypothetical protein